MKIGEVARVYLPEFNPDNGNYSLLDETYQKYRDRGYSFKVIPAKDVGKYLKKFRRISDQWIEANDADEIGFSQGVFNKQYLGKFSIASVFKDGEPVAFANIWKGAGKYELSFDLLRNTPESQTDIIDYLLVELMLWGKQEGYKWFSLGMAPLSGMKNHQHTQRWSKVADWVYTYGENIYNFKEVRKYREKFNPEWEPRFLAVPGGWALPGALKDMTNLISGGIKGFF
jgi:phosphatidylglycerol lysyltransferase